MKVESTSAEDVSKQLPNHSCIEWLLATPSRVVEDTCYVSLDKAGHRCIRMLWKIFIWAAEVACILIKGLLTMPRKHVRCHAGSR